MNENLVEIDAIECSEEVLGDLFQTVLKLSFKPGQYIFYAKHYPLGLFFLIEGEIDVLGEKDKLIDTIKPHVIIGAKTFLSETSYKVSARAKTKCELYFLSRGLFKRLATEGHPISHLFT